MSYVTKMGAYGFAVVAAFAVALAVLLSVSSTSTVEAEDIDVIDGTATVQPGDTAVMTQAGRIVRFTIDSENSTSSGSFDSGDGQTVACSDDAACDTGVDADGGDEPNSIQVKMNVDADSADGFIIVKTAVVIDADGLVGTAAADRTIVITVKTQPKPATLTAKAASTTVAASETDPPSDADQTMITATVKNDQDPPVGVVGETLTFITTLGLLDCDGTGGNAPSQVCQADTVVEDSDPDITTLGTATVALIGGGREGSAVITITHGTLDPATVEATFYGAAKNLNAEVEQGSVEQGGTVAVILTVTDAAGSAVKGQSPTKAAKDDIVGPEEDSNAVTADFGVNREKDGKVVIPACTAHIPRVADDQADPPVTASLGSSGTDDDGQCIVMVTAPAEDEDTAGDQAATRGINTLNFALGDKISAEVEVEVAGAAASIESDAPESVDPLSDTTVTITVRDDEGVLVGETAINVIKVAGDGLAEGKATAEGAKTTDGSAQFSYAAGLEGQVVFRVIAGSGGSAVRDIITLQVGVPVEEPPPAPPSLSKVPSPTGVTLLTFSGGTVAELGTAVTTACSGGGTVYATDYQGRWVSYIPAAMIAALNASFEALFPAGVPAGESLLVGNCGGG